jgi:hypothetical protein
MSAKDQSRDGQGTEGALCQAAEDGEMKSTARPVQTFAKVRSMVVAVILGC